MITEKSCYQADAAIYAMFKDFYEEELSGNAFYPYMLTALRNKAGWTAENWDSAVSELHNFEYDCFKRAYRRLDSLSRGHAQDVVRLNEFVFFRSAFERD
ncbi:MAG: hypothetical protein Q3966_08150 [Neisseria sp.]|nr:hypothetical protein [Neisseria sp.]